MKINITHIGENTMRFLRPILSQVVLFALVIGLTVGALNLIDGKLHVPGSVAAQDTHIVPLGEQPEYYVAIAYLVSNRDYMPSTVQLPPQGRKWLLPVITFGNVHGEPVTIQSGNVALIDQDGNRHAPLPASGQRLHSVLGTELEPGERVHGALLFLVPSQVQPVAVEWCPDEPDCEDPIEAPVP